MEHAKDGLIYTLGKNITSCKTPKIATGSQKLIFCKTVNVYLKLVPYNFRIKVLRKPILTCT